MNNDLKKMFLFLLKKEMKRNKRKPILSHKISFCPFLIEPKLNQKWKYMLFTYVFNKTPKEKFIEFLKDKNALDRFEYYLKTSRYKNIDTLCKCNGVDIGAYVSYPFNWSNTKEDYDYWHNIYREWIKIINRAYYTLEDLFNEN